MNQDIMYAVEALNGQIYDCTDDPEFVGFTFMSSGHCSMVSFMGQEIWNSENDPRNWDAANDKYEPMEDFLIREANKIFLKASKILWR